MAPSISATIEKNGLDGDKPSPDNMVLASEDYSLEEVWPPKNRDAREGGKSGILNLLFSTFNDLERIGWGKGETEGSRGEGGRFDKIERAFGTGLSIYHIVNTANYNMRDNEEDEVILQNLKSSIFRGKGPAVVPSEFEYLSTSEEVQAGATSCGRYRIRTSDGAFVGRDVDVYDAPGAPSVQSLFGFDGDKTVWQHDTISKVAVELEYDEREALILGVWAFHSLFLLDSIRKKIDMRVLPRDEAMGCLRNEVDDEGPTVAIELRLKKNLDDGQAHDITKIVYVIDTRTWLPKRYHCHYFGQVKTLDFTEWAATQSYMQATKTVSTEIDESVIVGRIVALSNLHFGEGGGSGTDGNNNNDDDDSDQTHHDERGTFSIPDLRGIGSSSNQMNNKYFFPDRLRADPRHGDVYSRPSNPPAPDLHINPEVSPEIKFTMGRSGHCLIPATVNGQDVGFWMLDTGASTNVITTWAAKRLGLEQFAPNNASVLGGMSQSALCKISTFSVGPMTWKDPIFNTMTLPSLQGEGVKIAGILGFDFFSQAVIELELDHQPIFGFNSKRRAFIRPAGHDVVTMGKEGGEEKQRAITGEVGAAMGSTGEDPETAMSFASLKFLSKVAHVEATVKGKHTERGSHNLMLLDIGAAGSHVVFNEEKAYAAGVVNSDCKSIRRKATIMTGAGGYNVDAHTAQIEYVEIGDVRIESKDMRATLVNTPNDLSAVCNGVLCIKVLEGCRVIFDYPRKRLGVQKLVPGLKSRPLRRPTPSKI
eukprot:jgi/Bigna1/134477/aug1.25_g9185